MSLMWFDGAELSGEQKEIAEVARKFAHDVIMPVAAQHDRTGEVGLHGPFHRRCYCLENTALSA